MNIETILLAYVALTQVGDFYTTYVGLNKGGVELNVVMRKLFDIFGIKLALLLKGVLVFLLCYFSNLVVIALVSIFYTILLIWNYTQLKKM